MWRDQGAVLQQIVQVELRTGFQSYDRMSAGTCHIKHQLRAASGRRTLAQDSQVHIGEVVRQRCPCQDVRQVDTAAVGYVDPQSIGTGDPIQTGTAACGTSTGRTLTTLLEARRQELLQRSHELRQLDWRGCRIARSRRTSGTRVVAACARGSGSTG